MQPSKPSGPYLRLIRTLLIPFRLQLCMNPRNLCHQYIYMRAINMSILPPIIWMPPSISKLTLYLNTIGVNSLRLGGLHLWAAGHVVVCEIMYFLTSFHTVFVLNCSGYPLGFINPLTTVSLIVITLPWRTQFIIPLH